MEKIFVWLDDDERRDPDSGWVIVRTADEAIELLKGNVAMISLDHDLGDIRNDPYPREITGMDVVDWMIENKIFPEIINVHSFNPSRALVMAERLVKNATESIVKRWAFGKDTAKDLEEEFWDMGKCNNNR
jgi:hypothetical protein